MSSTADSTRSDDGRNEPPIRSRRLPGGDLVAAVLDRELMILADRGGASGLVGDRWADLCADHVAAWDGQRRPVPGEPETIFEVSRVVRLDDSPEIAAAASRHGLQNPDLVIVGQVDGQSALQAADAKFSVETARAKQVSPSVLEALLGLGPLLHGYLGDIEIEPRLLPGVFLCPDFTLTHLMLRRRHGIVRTTVRADQVVTLPVPAVGFFETAEGFSLIDPLARVDDLPVRLEESLVAALYYFRLARAAVGCWLDETKPLLLANDRLVVDEDAIRTTIDRRGRDASSGFGLVRRWYADVEPIRAQRLEVDRVAALPLRTADLRPLISRTADEAGASPPSLNQVRRRLAAWYRLRLREQVGPLCPPVANMSPVLSSLSDLGRAMRPALELEATRIVRGLVDQHPDPRDLTLDYPSPAAEATS